jgi:hypothetical protein
MRCQIQSLSRDVKLSYFVCGETAKTCMHIVPHCVKSSCFRASLLQTTDLKGKQQRVQGQLGADLSYSIDE